MDNKPIIRMLDTVIEAGLDEDVMGWDPNCNSINRKDLEDLLNNDELFATFMVDALPMIRAKLQECAREYDLLCGDDEYLPPPCERIDDTSCSCGAKGDEECNKDCPSWLPPSERFRLGV